MRNHNYTEKNIKEFTNKDTIYVSKIISGFQYIYYCDFISFTKGNVTAKVISSDREHYHNQNGEQITARLTKCFLWDGNARYAQWFKKNGHA